MSTTTAGRFGEDTAVNFLKKLGYKIIARNFKSRYGELDIVAIDKNCLVFVEVKTRWNTKFGLPEEAVIPSKLKAIILTGQYFKIQNPKTPDAMRVDVVAIEISGDTIKDIRHLKNVSQ